MALETVRPCDCVLALGLSCTVAGLEKDVLKPHKEYARLTGGRLFPALERLFDSVTASVTRAGLDGRPGVTVCRNVTLEDLRQLLKPPAPRVVTLVSHWREPALAAADLLRPGRIHHALLSAEGGRIAALRDRMVASGVTWPTDSETAPPAAQTMADDLNAALAASRLFQYAARETSRAVDDMGVAVPPPLFTRVMLERMFSGCIVECAPLELADGMHPLGRFVQALDAEFDGTLDLMFCTSEFAMECVRERCPGCSPLGARSILLPPDCLTVYELTIARLRARSQPYAYARADVVEELRRRRNGQR